MGRQLIRLISVATIAFSATLFISGCGEKGEELPPPTGTKVDQKDAKLKGGEQSTAPKPGLNPNMNPSDVGANTGTKTK